MRKSLLILTVIVLFLFVLLPELVTPPFQIGFHLAFGWIAFLKRTLPQVNFNLSAVGLALICVVLILLGTHWFCSWLYHQIVSCNGETPKSAWRRRWTLGICLVTLLLFSTSIAITGICHQVAWWMTSKEPLYVSRYDKIVNILDMKQQALEIATVAEDNRWNLRATETNLTHSVLLSKPRFSIENWHRVLVPGTNDELFAAFVFHRDPNKRAKAGFCLVNREIREIYPIQKLPEELARYGLQWGSSLSIFPNSQP